LKMAMQPDVKALPDLASGEHGGRLAPPPDRHHHLHHLSIEIGREMRERGTRGRAPPEGEVAPHRGSPHRGSAEAAARKTSSSRPRRGRWPRSRTSRRHRISSWGDLGDGDLVVGEEGDAGSRRRGEEVAPCRREKSQPAPPPPQLCENLK
jgi:hypothetical protein